MRGAALLHLLLTACAPRLSTSDPQPRCDVHANGELNLVPGPDRLLPLTFGSTWSYSVTTPGEGATVGKTVSVGGVEPLPVLPGSDRCDKTGAGIVLRRAVTDGTRRDRFMSSDDDGVWWELEPRYDHDRLIADVVYCPRKLRIPEACTTTGEVATHEFEEVITSFQGECTADDQCKSGRCVRDEADLPLGVCACESTDQCDAARGEQCVEGRWCATEAVSSVRVIDTWEVIAGVGDEETLTVPAGTFDTVHYRRSLDDGHSVEVADFWFARGVGKVREETKYVETEELSSFCIGACGQ